MKRLTKNHCKLRLYCQYLLALGLGLGLCAISHADGFSNEQYIPPLDPFSQSIASDSQVVICGGQPGQRAASLTIRGADIATLWRSAYRMLFPGSSLAAASEVDTHAGLPHKGPAWGIRVNHGGAVVTLQTRW